MPKTDYLFTSESVSEGHPDKVCDRISDTVVDTYLTADPYSRVGVETLCTTNLIVLAGEVRGPDTITHATLEDVARAAVKAIGYEQERFHWRDAEGRIPLQSPSTGIPPGGDPAGHKGESPGGHGPLVRVGGTHTPGALSAPPY